MPDHLHTPTTIQCAETCTRQAGCCKHTCKLSHDLHPRLSELAIRDEEDVRIGPGSRVKPVQAPCDGLIKVRASIEHLDSTSWLFANGRLLMITLRQKGCLCICKLKRAKTSKNLPMGTVPFQGSPGGCSQRPCLFQAPAHAPPAAPQKQTQSSRAPAGQLQDQQWKASPLSSINTIEGGIMPGGQHVSTAGPS